MTDKELEEAIAEALRDWRLLADPDLKQTAKEIYEDLLEYRGKTKKFRALTKEHEN